LSVNHSGVGRSVAGKITAILLTFAPGESLSMTEIVRRTGLSSSTAHRLLGELEAERLLERDEQGQYRTALPLRTIAARGEVDTADLIERGLRTLEDLAAVTGARARLGTLRNGKVAFLEKGRQHRETSFSRARLQPVHASTMGQALLAFSPVEQVTAMIDRGARTRPVNRITSTAHLRRALGTIQRTRVAVHCAEFEPDLCAVAAPVFGPGGHIAAAIELAVPPESGNHAHTTLVAMLYIASRSLSRDLTAAAERTAHADIVDRMESLTVNGT
jgi:DNA-binding IclR family transcriptional regulator